MQMQTQVWAVSTVHDSNASDNDGHWLLPLTCSMNASRLWDSSSEHMHACKRVRTKLRCPYHVLPHMRSHQSPCSRPSDETVAPSGMWSPSKRKRRESRSKPLASQYALTILCRLVCVCVCCFVLLNQYLELRSRGHSLRQETWGGWILTLHLNYVAGYTGPLLFLFEQTHNCYVDNHGLVPWRLRRVGRSKVRSASLVRVLGDDKISWKRGPKV